MLTIKAVSYCPIVKCITLLCLTQISTACILTYLKLLCLTQISTANDRSTVLLTGPAEVSHRPCNVWEKMPPDLAERGVCSSPL